jgi:general secretion pathway protein N
VNKSRLLWAVILALFLFVYLVVSAPARLLHLVVPGGQLLMHGVTGSVWRGSASSLQVRLPQGYVHLGSVQWSLQPLSLLMLAPRVSLNSNWGNQDFSGELVFRGQRDLGVYDFEGQVAADLLRHFAPVALDGMFNLQMTELQLRDGLPYSAQGRLVWQEGGWLSPRGLVPLGTYALDFQQSPGEALSAEIITLSGPLQASGGVEMQGRHYDVDILVGSSEQSLDPQLQDMLSLIATPEGNEYRISVKSDF